MGKVNTLAKVTVKKGTDFANIKRDEAAFAPTAAPIQAGAQRPGGAAVRPGQPNIQAVPNGQNAIRPPGSFQPPANGIPKPGAIPKPPNVVPPPNNVPVQPGVVPPGQADPRKRIRVINSK